MDDIEAATREFEPETHAIIGAAVEVHRVLGAGFLEAVYHEALADELARRGLPFQHEVAVPIHYKGKRLSTVYRADFVCFGRFIVELKASVGVGRADEAQVVNYLHATGLKIGLLFNFAAPTLHIRRLATTRVERPDEAFPGFSGFPATSN